MSQESIPVDPVREQMKEAARAAAFDEGRECPTCEGHGRLDDGGRKLIHSLLGAFGADWNLDGVLDAIDRAEEVAWANTIFSHDLLVRVDGKVYGFAVPIPEGVAPVNARAAVSDA